MHCIEPSSLFTKMIIFFLHEYANMQFKIIDDNAKLPPVSTTQQAETLPPLSPLRQRRRFGRRTSRHSSTSKRCRWSNGDLTSSPATCQKTLPIPSRPEDYRRITQHEHFGFCTSIDESGSSGCVAQCQQDSTPRLPCRRLSNIPDCRLQQVDQEITNAIKQ